MDQINFTQNNLLIGVGYSIEFVFKVKQNNWFYYLGMMLYQIFETYYKLYISWKPWKYGIFFWLRIIKKPKIDISLF